jgi:hypothetical protein
LQNALPGQSARHGGGFVRVQLQAALRGAQGLRHGLLLGMQREVVGGARDVQQDARNADDDDKRDGNDEQCADTFDPGHGREPPTKICAMLILL